MTTAMTIPPRPEETAAILVFESHYAKDSLGFVRWLASGECLTDEMASAKALLEKENKQ